MSESRSSLLRLLISRSGRSLPWLALALMLTPFAATHAQQGGDEEEAVELEAIQTTGSRIRRVYTEGSSPVYTLTREDLERTGETNIADILQQLTTGGSALNTRLNSSGNFGFPPSGAGVGAGAAAVNLRHLGAQRTLVLVNGLRWINESSASGVSSIVDLNTIPLAIVERIEILEDGASAVYGTDAIGGVVNIILRDEMNGGEALAYFGQFDEGDGESIRAEATIGGTFDKLSIIVNASYNNDRSISAGDREISSFPVPGTGVTRGSSGTPNTRFIFNPPEANAVCPLIDSNDDGVPDTPFCNITTPNGSSFPNGANFPEDFIGFTNENRFNFSPFNLLATPNERTSVYTQLNYQVSNNVNLYFRGMFNERTSTNQAAPEPIFLGPGAGTGNPLADDITISASNPFNPFGIDLISGVNFELLGRRPIEAGPRIFKQDVDTRYLATGATGSITLGDRAFFWDVNLVDAESEAVQTTQGSFNIRRIAEALGPVDRCLNDIPGCVPLDLFNGPGTLTQEMIDFIEFPGVDTSEQDLEIVSANISGGLFELPAGEVGIAVGFEHRELSGSFQPDSVIVAGESNGVPALPTSGGFNVEEIYGELDIPVLSDIPGIHRLDLNGAIRLSDFSTAGTSTTVKAGFRWEVTEDLLFRGSYAEGIRAPGIGELFGSASRFDAILDDPCSNFQNSGVSQQVIDNCLALGVPSTFVQANQQISVTTGGNDVLRPETSDSWSTGLVYSPSWVEGFDAIARLDFGVTWYRHELDDAIQAVDAQTQLNACLNDINSGFCDGITRSVTGAINGFQNRLQNIGGINTSGFDFSINYSSPDYSFGRVFMTWNTTFVDNFSELLINPDDPNDPLIRRLVGVEENDSAIPEWQSNMVLGWNRGDWQSSFNLRYTDSVTESCSDFLDGTANSLTNLGLCSNPDFDNNGNSTNTLASRIYVDFQLGYSFDLTEKYKLSLTGGVENLFDKDPPLCFSCSLNGFDVTTHELPGQFWYVRGVLRF
ncbi:MAG: TonB-dependent receptor [Gammaproteobacteria bacterium]|nr:TonB-dependent receptor [Gammaproteobacteria bacterium]